MKSKIIFLTLAATISLGACTASQGSRSAMVDNKQSVKVFHDEELERADVRRVQRLLAREDFYRGPIDGIWGAQTSQAILNYQTAHHPNQTDVTVDTLQEFGVKVDQNYDRSH